MQKEVKFTKWIDPLQVLLEEHDRIQDSHKFSKDIDDEDDLGDFEEPMTDIPRNNRLGPCIVGPQGIIPISEFNLPGRIYNFWLLHTNFNITQDLAIEISQVKGVESLNVFTRYRARFSIGQLFKIDHVQTDIRKLLCEVKSKPKVTDTPGYKNIELFLAKKYPYWAIVTKNSTFKPIGGDSIEHVNQELDKEKGYQNIVRSWDNG